MILFFQQLSIEICDHSLHFQNEIFDFDLLQFRDALSAGAAEYDDRTSADG